MIDWSTETVESCLESLSFRKIPKVLARDYKPSGSYPIIDQGQNLIAGWTDDDSVLISIDLPIVIFGDHTRVFKYIDFPFVRGADGTQLLKPKAGIEPLFFYYACRAINLPSRGYNRHFKALKEKNIPIPPIGEQRNIARILRRIDDAISLQDEQLQVATDLKRSTMHTLFTRGLRGEAQKETEIGLIPESWKVSTLGEVAQLKRGRFMHRPRNEPRFYGGAMPFVQTGDVVRSGGRIREFVQTLNEDGVAISRVFPAGTILITIAANIGFTGVLQFDSACPDSLIAITPNHSLNAEFLEYFLQTQQKKMDELAPKGTQKNINIQFLTPWPVVIPPKDEQREIITILNVINNKIDLHRKKRAVLDDLFKALLHKLMTGEIRVGSLDS
ncbi:MAG: restriction endonuclease subunit S [Gemmatimonadetes bacterium]|nr:restriction endonuclease subunit S [Gemmatimonadota bacterium]